MLLPFRNRTLFACRQEFIKILYGLMLFLEFTYLVVMDGTF
jgi:hypothetical protein